MQQSIAQLVSIISDYTAQLQQLTEQEVAYKPSANKWSGKEYLGHLIDSAQNNIRRFVVAQYEDRPHIVYQQDTWVAAANYQQYPWTDLLNLWMLLNKHLVSVLANIPESMYDREVLTGDIHTLQWLAADYNKHLLHHLHQVLKREPVTYP